MNEILASPIYKLHLDPIQKHRVKDQIFKHEIFPVNLFIALFSP